MKQILLISSDNAGAISLDDRPPMGPIAPGTDFKHTAHLQHGPVVFARLCLGPCAGVSALGTRGLSSIGPDGSAWDASAWRVDEVTIDEEPINHRQTPCGFGSRTSLHVTNVGEVPAHFYAYWECEPIQ